MAFVYPLAFPIKITLQTFSWIKMSLQKAFRGGLCEVGILGLPAAGSGRGALNSEKWGQGD